MNANDPLLSFGLDLRQLRFFLEVADAGSLSAAARNLHYSQPPLSRHIHYLESVLNAKLFHRRTSGVELTEAGKTLRRHARVVLQQLNDTIRAVQCSQSRSQTYLHVGFTPSPTEIFREYAIRFVEQRFPSIRIILEDIPVEECLEKLARRELQFALTVEPTRHKLRHFQFVPLFSYEMRCAISAGHPLARHTHITIKQLADLQLLIFSRRHMPQYARYLRQAFRPHKMRLAPSAEFDGISTLLPAIERGHGVALLLESAKGLASKEIKWLRLTPALPKVRVGILYHKPIDQSLRDILRTLKQAVHRRFLPRKAGAVRPSDKRS